MRKKNLFMALTIFFGLCCGAFYFNGADVHWLWAQTPGILLLLIALTLVSGAGWYRASRKAAD